MADEINVSKKYMFAGSGTRFEGQLVREVTESFFVENVVQKTDPKTALGFTYAALEAPGIPKLWSKHPFCVSKSGDSAMVEQVLRCANRVVTPQGGTTARVDCQYLNTGPFLEVRGGSRFESVQTDLAFNGGDALFPVIVAKDYGTLGATTGYLYQGAMFNRDVPIGVMILHMVRPNVSRLGSLTLDDGDAAISPPDWQNKYHGGINNAEVPIGGSKFPKSTLRVENISYDNVGWGDVAFNLQIELAYNPMTWHVDVSYIDPSTGAPDKNVAVSHTILFNKNDVDDPRAANAVGRKRIQRHRYVDFSAAILKTNK